MGTVLAVVHPEQYETGLAILDRIEGDGMSLRQPEAAEEMLKTWCCPFSGVTALCNARTPEHRDPNGRDNWYDILATVGDYKGHRLQLPGLGTSLTYDPGTVVAICGRLISHSVEFVEGDRASLAGFMREDVRQGFDLPPGGYSKIDQFQA